MNSPDNIITYNTFNNKVIDILIETLIQYTNEPIRNKFTIKCNRIFIDDVTKWFNSVFNNLTKGNIQEKDTDKFKYMSNVFELEHHKIIDDNKSAYGLIKFNGKYIEIKHRK